jgi:hypothetical protein
MTSSLKKNQSPIRVLQALKERVHPDDAWVQATRAHLLRQAQATLVAKQPSSMTKSLKSVFEIIFPLRLVNFIGAPVMALVMVALIALGGSVASVSAADRSLPGDFLYSLKLATEQARLVLTAKDEKLKLKLEFTSLRTEELEQVVALDGISGTRALQAAEVLKRDLHTVKQQLNDMKKDVSSQKAVEIAKLVDQKSNEVVQKLQATKSTLPENAKGKVVEAQAAAADAGVQALEVLIEKSKEPEGEFLTEEIVQAIEDHTKTVADATGGAGLVASSSAALLTATTTTTTLDQAIEQTKVATQQAFALTLLRETSIETGSSTIEVLSGSTTTPVASSSVTTTVPVIVTTSSTASATTTSNTSNLPTASATTTSTTPP